MGRLRRNTELGLILLGAVVTVGAYALVVLGVTDGLPVDLGPFLGIVLGLLLLAHLANRRLAPNADGLLLPLAGLLNGMGYVFIVRLDEDLGALQANWTIIGVGAYVGTLFAVRRVRLLEQYRYTAALVGIGLLVLPLLPFVGREIKGARIWVSFGPVNFQPGEFAKIVLAVFLAGYLVDKRELLAMSTRRLGPMMLPDPKHFGPLLLAWVASLVVMVAEKDLGSSLLFFALFVVVLWVGTERVVYLVSGLALFSGGAFVAWRTFAHVQQRVDIWLDPWADPSGRGYQIVEAAFSLAQGGLTGTGLGLGDPGRVPEAATDFVFAAIGEELGLVGATAVMFAYVLMIGSGLRIAQQASGTFETLLATGLTLLLGLQSFIIMGGVIRLLPLTGVTLPFVSYGGSSLVANYVLLALLMRVSDEDTASAEAEGAAGREPVGAQS